MWFYSGYRTLPKSIISVIFVIIFIFGYCGNSNTKNNEITVANNNAIDTNTCKEESENVEAEITEVESVKLTGWQREGSNSYYYDQDGVKKTGWIEDGGKYYYCSNTGEMQTGWIEDNNKYYYLNDNGEMQTGWVQDKNNWYYLNSDGIMSTNTSIEGYVIDSNGIATKEVPKLSKSNDLNNISKSSKGTTTNEPAESDRTVYWVPAGKSYHYRKDCPTLKRSKNILSGKGSECPKTDPCDKCVR